MSEKSKYYKVLGIRPKANLMQIRTAYKKLCLKYHPDKHESKSSKEKKEMERKFKEIKKAYDILTDKGDDDIRKYQEMEDAGVFGDSFKETKRRKFKIRDVKCHYVMTLKEAYNGELAKVTFNRYNLKRKTSTLDDLRCIECDGKGFESRIEEVKSILQRVKRKCEDCKGTGIDQECIVNESVSRDLLLPKGIYERQYVMLKGEGNEMPGRGRTDVKVKIREIRKFKVPQTSGSTVKKRDHPGGLEFTRGITDSPYNLRIEINIKKHQELCGTNFSFTHLDGSIKQIFIPHTRRSKVVMAKHLGMPFLHSPSGQFGDLIIRLTSIPSKMSAKKRSLVHKTITGKELIISDMGGVKTTDYDEDDDVDMPIGTYFNLDINTDSEREYEEDPSNCKQQ